MKNIDFVSDPRGGVQLLAWESDFDEERISPFQYLSIRVTVEKAIALHRQLGEILHLSGGEKPATQLLDDYRREKADFTKFYFGL